MLYEVITIGSWTAFSGTCGNDSDGNSFSIDNSLLVDSRNTLVASDDHDHLVAGIGLDNFIVIHTPKATLICPKDRDQDIKDLYNAVKEKFGDEFI